MTMGSLVIEWTVRRLEASHRPAGRQRHRLMWATHLRRTDLLQRSSTLRWGFGRTGSSGVRATGGTGFTASGGLGRYNPIPLLHCVDMSFCIPARQIRHLPTMSCSRQYAVQRSLTLQPIRSDVVSSLRRPPIGTTSQSNPRSASLVCAKCPALSTKCKPETNRTSHFRHTHIVDAQSHVEQQCAGMILSLTA